MTTDLEATISDVEPRIDEVARQAKGVIACLTRARAMAAKSDINGIVAELGKAPEAADRLTAALRDLAGSFKFGIEWAFRNGTFVEELKADAKRQGVMLVVRDGRLSAFPLPLKLDIKTPGARVGRRTVKAIRPSILIKSLKSAQMASRFNAVNFLDQIWFAYLHLVPGGWMPQGGTDSPVVSLSRIYSLLTLTLSIAAKLVAIDAEFNTRRKA
jgi:hypothetical protein